MSILSWVVLLYIFAGISILFGVSLASQPIEITGWTQPETFFYSLPFAVAAALSGGVATTLDTPDLWKDDV